MHIAAISFSMPAPLPLLARAVRAGFPSPADDFVEEEIDLQRLLVINRAATFLVRVAGDSMLCKGLFDGDLAIVDRSLMPQDGDVVVVDVDGERSFKVWGRQGIVVTLSFARRGSRRRYRHGRPTKRPRNANRTEDPGRRDDVRRSCPSTLVVRRAESFLAQYSVRTLLWCHWQTSVRECLLSPVPPQVDF